jgi:hypothetical protein
MKSSQGGVVKQIFRKRRTPDKPPGRIDNFLTECFARRRGRQALLGAGTPTDNLRRTLRHVGGYYIPIPTSRLMNAIEEGSEAFNRSLSDPHLPPSTHISHNDVIRRGMVIPVSERCIEDWDAEPLEPVVFDD